MKRRRFDSDDDDDEYITTVREPLSEFPVSMPHDTMLELGLMSSGTDEDVVPLQSYEAEERENGAPNAATSPVSSPTQQSALSLSSYHPEDRDIPPEWRRLFSDSLLRVYYTPLSYIAVQRAMDDKLLAQYLPYDVETVQSVLSGKTDEPQQYRNPFGIRPGRRWDGVVRGRKNKE